MPTITEDTKIPLRMVFLIGGWLLSMATLYYGLSSKIDVQAETLKNLKETLSDTKAKVDTEERALIELSVTLGAHKERGGQ